MAGTIAATVILSLSVSGSKIVNWDSGALSFTQTGSRFVQSFVNVTTGMTAVPLAVGTGTVGYIMIQSLETATNNFIYIATTTGATTGDAVFKLGASDFAVFKAGGSMQAPAMSAVTAGQIRLISFEL